MLSVACTSPHTCGHGSSPSPVVEIPFLHSWYHTLIFFCFDGFDPVEGRESIILTVYLLHSCVVEEGLSSLTGAIDELVEDRKRAKAHPCWLQLLPLVSVFISHISIIVSKKLSIPDWNHVMSEIRSKLTPHGVDFFKRVSHCILKTFIGLFLAIFQLQSIINKTSVYKLDTNKTTSWTSRLPEQILLKGQLGRISASHFLSAQ